MYEGQPLFSDVDHYLRARGFHFVKYLPPLATTLKPTFIEGSHLKGNIWVGADAIYIRDWNNLDVISTSKMKKLAIITHDVYKMTDVAYFFLMEIDRREGSRLANSYMDALNGTTTQHATE